MDEPDVYTMVGDEGFERLVAAFSGRAAQPIAAVTGATSWRRSF